jgi:hypothetical protein
VRYQFRLALRYAILSSITLGAISQHALAEPASEMISSQQYAEVKESSVGTYLGGILARGDVNGDGNDDLLVGIQSAQYDYPNIVFKSKGILLIYDPATTSYVPSEKFRQVADFQIWPRRAVIYDFDRNGYGDIFIAGTGTDGLKIMHCGDQNSMIMSFSDKFLNATDGLPNVGDYSHGLATGDVNGDMVDDIVVLNSPFIDEQCPADKKYTNNSYVLDGASVASGKTLKISGAARKINFKGRANFAHAGLAHDLNGDGVADIIVGGDFTASILESKGALSYSAVAQFSPPKEFYSSFDTKNCLSDAGVCYTPYTSFVAIDIDGDGAEEIIASLVNQAESGGWKGQYFQVLQKKDGKWRDATIEFMPDQPQRQAADGIWCNDLFSYDINQDNRDDLICSSIGGFARPFWINQGDYLLRSDANPSQSFIVPIQLRTGRRLVGLEALLGRGTIDGIKVHFLD